jgi:hypothetical protein
VATNRAAAVSITLEKLAFPVGERDLPLFSARA